MAKQLPGGFDPAKVRAGILTAMEFGRPNQTADQATFAFDPPGDAGEGVPVDDEGVPFDSDVKPARSPVRKTVPCAVEFFAAGDRSENFGTLTGARIKITLMKTEYDKVKGFDWVVAGGDRYYYKLTEPPVALGTLDFFFVWATTEDER